MLRSFFEKTLSHPLDPSLMSLSAVGAIRVMLIELRKGMTLHPCTFTR